MDIRALLVALIVSTLSAPATAHHSFSMFDSDKTLSITGIVKEYEWSNPHVWIYLVAPGAGGKPLDWSFEMQSVQQDAAAGWKPDSVRPGDRITVVYHPLKDGSRGGQLMSATLADGLQLGPPVSAKLLDEEAAHAKAKGTTPTTR